MAQTMTTYTPVRFDITGQVPPLAEPLEIAGWVFAPPSTLPAKPIVLICLPGGSYTKAYWHLEVPRSHPDTYSFALYMARRGFVVVAIDHLGVGESASPEGTLLTMQVMATANAAATRQVRQRLQDGTLAGITVGQEPLVVGVGHSMGSFLLLTQQAAHRSFHAAALLGYTNGALHLAGMERRLAESQGLEGGSFYQLMEQMYRAAERGYVLMDRAIARSLFYADDVPPSVIAADEALASVFPVGITRDLNSPQAMLEKAARVDIPLFLGNGDLDISADFRAEPGTYPNVRDLTLFQLAESAHCHNVSSSRHILWDRLARWILGLQP